MLVVGEVEHLLANAHKLGEEIADAEAQSVAMETAQVVVSNPAVIGCELNELELAEWVGVLPLRVRRSRTELPLTGELELRRGDVLSVYGPGESIDKLAA